MDSTTLTTTTVVPTDTTTLIKDTNTLLIVQNVFLFAIIVILAFGYAIKPFLKEVK